MGLEAYHATVWEFVEQNLIVRGIPCDEKRLSEYAALVGREAAKGHDDVVSFIARQHDEGLTEELLAEICERYPDDAGKMGLAVLPQVKRRNTSSAEEDPPLLVVSIEKRTVTLNDVKYDLTEQQARWLKVLSDNPGVWIASPRLQDYDSELIGARTGRIYKALPQKIKAIVEPKPGCGSRLNLA